MSFEIDRHRYLELFGPTKGDKIRLGDTDLLLKLKKIIQDMVRNINLEVVRS